MTVHINRFIDKIKTAESKQQRDLVLSITDAKNLHSDITKLLLVLQELQTKKQPAESSTDVRVELDGGSF